MQTKTPAVLLAAAVALAAALSITTGALARDDSSAPQPKLLNAELVTAPEINHGTSAVLFRTDHALARGHNGGTVEGHAGVGGGASLQTVHGAHGHPCYVAYVTRSLRVGRRYDVEIEIGDVEHHRTLKLHPTGHVAEKGADLGC